MAWAGLVVPVVLAARAATRGESWLTLAADVRVPEREAETAGRFLVDV